MRGENAPPYRSRYLAADYFVLLFGCIPACLYIITVPVKLSLTIGFLQHDRR